MSRGRSWVRASGGRRLSFSEVGRHRAGRTDGRCASTASQSTRIVVRSICDRAEPHAVAPATTIGLKLRARARGRPRRSHGDDSAVSLPRAAAIGERAPRGTGVVVAREQRVRRRGAARTGARRRHVDGEAAADTRIRVARRAVDGRTLPQPARRSVADELSSRPRRSASVANSADESTSGATAARGRAASASARRAERNQLAPALGEYPDAAMAHGPRLCAASDSGRPHAEMVEASAASQPARPRTRRLRRQRAAPRGRRAPRVHAAEARARGGGGARRRRRRRPARRARSACASCRCAAACGARARARSARLPARAALTSPRPREYGEGEERARVSRGGARRVTRSLPGRRTTDAPPGRALPTRRRAPR